VSAVTGIRVWAPNAAVVALRVAGSDTSMQRDADGWWHGPDIPAGTDYAFVLDGGPPRPDPASRWQPYGVHGPSRVYDQGGYRWQDGDWRGHDLTRAIGYELHVGTFTPGATLDSAIDRLDHVVALGVTHLELLPVNAVNGVWNWGYDGVGWYAVHEPYGGPDALKRFVDAAHAHGLAVVLDVVYNHLGASGNYLPEFGPYLKAGHNTWGDFVNFEEPAVRRFVLDNAQMWFRDFHLDALRLDAVHAIVDHSRVHILAELAAEVDALAEHLGRPLSLIAESDLNDPVMITPRPEGYGLTAQWDDDVHHALHALLTGERQGYYCDFGSLSALAKVLTRAFLHDGTYSTFRGTEYGRPVDRARTEAWRFVVCLQNHDQVGNRAAGERLTELASPGLLRVGAVLLLTAPFTPMLWMGEEWAATTRWPFFTSHPEPELARVIGPGRLEEFEGYGWDESQMVDPQDPAAYRNAILDWTEPARDPHAGVLELYRALVALRRAEPDLTDPDLRHVEVNFDESAQWVVVHRGSLHVAANLAATAQVVPVPSGTVALATAAAEFDERGLRLGGESAAVIRRAQASPR
jgi:maltooligosyltrehalose trehalohydrolase